MSVHSRDQTTTPPEMTSLHEYGGITKICHIFLVAMRKGLLRKQASRGPLKYGMMWWCSTVSDSLQPPWTVTRQAPLSRRLSRKNTEVGCHALLQGIFPAQESNPRLLHLLYWQADSLSLCHLGSPANSC